MFEDGSVINNITMIVRQWNSLAEIAGYYF
jgi:hypothetical protein